MKQTYVKQLELDRYKVHSWRTFLTSIGAYAGSVGCFIGACVFPPGAPAFLAVGGILYGAGVTSQATSLGTKISDIVENNTYYKTDDMSKYDK